MYPPLEILYEDNHLLAVNKPHGLLTQPTDQESLSLENLCKEWLKDKYQKPGNAFLGTIHRLDKPVSGVVLFAKTSKALSRLNEDMRAQKMTKCYQALMETKPIPDSGILEHCLIHDDFMAKISKNGKPASLSYKFLNYFDKYALVEITLHTGKYHQIRAQLSAINRPIIGDAKYGSTLAFPNGAIALHHKSLTINHPITKKILVIHAKDNFTNFFI